MQGAIVALLSLHILFGQPPPVFSSIGKEIKQETTVRSWEKLGAQALLKVNWNWKPSLSGWNIKFYPGRRGYLGMSNASKHKIDIWVRAKHSPENVARTIVHELAHAFDYEYLDNNSRATWLVARNISSDTPWYPSCDGCSDYRFGSGDFAECVSFTLQKPTGTFRSKLGPPPNKSQQALIRKWLNELPKAARK